MEFATIDVDIRTSTGKGLARRTRAAGKVPAVIYGHKQTPVSIALDPLELLRTMDKQRRRNTVFTLNVGEGDKKQAVTAMIRDAQIDPISRNIQHIDFIRINLDEEVHVEVPLVLTGNPVGVVNGGNLHHGVHELSIAAKPDAIPAAIEVDVSGLDIGDVLHVSDVKFAEGVRPLTDEDTAIASIVTVEVEVAPAPAAAAEGEAAAAAPGAEAGKEGDKEAKK